MGFRKYEVLVRKNSKVDIDNVIEMFKKAVDDKQANDPNTLWAVNIFDLRTLKEYMIFSNKAAETFDIIDKYKTKDNKEINAVLNLGQKILDVATTIKNGIIKNSDLITNIAVNQIPQIKKVDSIEDKITSMNSKLLELENIKIEINKSIKEIENTFNIKLKDISDIVNKIQKNYQQQTIDNETLQKIEEFMKNNNSEKLNSLQEKINSLLELQEKVNNLENQLKSLIKSDNTNKDDSDIDKILEKLVNNEELTPEEQEKLKNLLGNSEGYII